MDRIEYNSCVDNYSDLLYRFILKSSSNRELSEDVVQESFITLWEHAEQIVFGKAKSYLFTTAYRKMIDQYRRNKRSVALDDAMVVASNDNTLSFDLSAQLDRGLERLPDIQRHVLLLRDYEGYSYEEIGTITDLSENQVKVYIFRARNSLRNFIKREDGNYE